ncbi:HipA domain-containing protein [Povalibacter sp.]|uniref:HipA domain-containing protein n=1 Tax=Povalibacter sp. TaxID=1962978 RepID=UPI002F423E21
MSAATRELVATINGRSVGRLREQNNLWVFEYDPAWIATGFDLSPHLLRTTGTITDGATSRPVQWFFDNLLPEEQARDLLAADAKIPAADAFGLLAYYGRESAGAITLRAPGEAAGRSGYVALTDAELSARIKKLPQQGLAAGAPKRMSLAGAQHKMAVSMVKGALFFPEGETPSTHLLKPDHVDRENWPNSVANKFFTMRLADHMGLRVPTVQIRYVPQPVYLIERFDRQQVGEETRRLHIIDACQLLGLDRTFKYQQATAQTFASIIEKCTNRARARQGIAAWVLFNLLTGNADAHLKNLSFHVDAEGIQLAPFYDLVSTEAYHTAPGSTPQWPHTPLSTKIGDAATFAQVDAEKYTDFAEALGLTRTATNRLIADYTGRIEAAADDLIKELEGMKVAPATRAGQLRVIRTVRMIVIREMVARLTP